MGFGDFGFFFPNGANVAYREQHSSIEN